MSKKYNEEVLVFNENLLSTLNGQTGIIPYNEEFQDKISANCYFLDRNVAEESPQFKQLIPYCVLRREDSIFVYKRNKKGGESRLHDLLSLGVGGHINPVDFKRDDNFLLNCIQRELEEEVRIIGAHTGMPISYIYDDSNDVGKVHFGVIVEIKLNKFTELVLAEELSDGDFLQATEVLEKKDQFENWSKIVIENYIHV